MAIYLGDEKNLARKILKFYIGDDNGVARKVTKAYIGDANGVARLFYTAHVHAYLSNNDYDFDYTISTSQHYYTKSCECGDTITEWEDHDFQHYYQAPTCTEDGFEEEICRCGYGGGRDLPAYGHTEVTLDALEPTCVQGGNTVGITCSVCGEWLVQPIPLDPLGHDYSDATCTEPATCSRCGATTGSALGHDYSDATCTEPATCSRCGATTGLVLIHDYEPTGIYEFIADGSMYEIYECTRCGDTYLEYVGSSGGEDSSSTT